MNGDTAVSGPCTSLEHRDHGPHPDCDQPWCTCPCHTEAARIRRALDVRARSNLRCRD